MIDKTILKKLAKLARIEIEDEDNMLKLLNQEIETVKLMDTVDTEGLEALNNPYEIELDVKEDIVTDGDKQEELMKVAPKSMYNYYIVPKVVE